MSTHLLEVFIVNPSLKLLKMKIKTKTKSNDKKIDWLDFIFIILTYYLNVCNVQERPESPSVQVLLLIYNLLDEMSKQLPPV